MVLRPISLIAACVLLLLLCVCQEVVAQQPVFKCTRLTTENGLSDNMVFCALQDKYGFMWFGTRDGLNRYDGYRFTVYRHNPKDTTTLASNGIECLFEDKKGTLWVGTFGCLHKFERESRRFIRYTDSLLRGGVGVARLCDDIQGNIWMTTSLPYPRLVKFNPTTTEFTHYQRDLHNPYSLSSLTANRVSRDNAGNVWALMDSALNRYDSRTNTFVNFRNTSGYKYTHGPSHFLVAGDNNNLWIGDTTDTVINLFYTADSLWYRVFVPDKKDKLPGNIASMVVPDRYGITWVGTFSNGLYTLDTATGRYAAVLQDNNSPYTLPSKQIFSLYKDRNGSLWVCSDAGIAKFQYRTKDFQHYSEQSGLSYPNVRVIAKHRNGNLLIGTGGGGADVWEKQAFSHISPSAFLQKKDANANTINTVYRDTKETVWLGTNAGLYTLHKHSHTYQPSTIPLSGWRVWSIVEDSDGNLWVGTLRGGLTKISAKNRQSMFFWHKKDKDNNKSGIGVFCFLESPKNTLWVGTTDGLYKMNTQTNTWHRYQIGDSTGFNTDDVWFLHQTRDGALWLATSGAGLNRFDSRSETFTSVTTNDGLPSNIICAILEDNHGNLWVSTSKGLARFNPKNKKVKTFGVGDGLYISEFHFKTCFKDADGSMYFGGTGGYVHFHPDSIADNTTPPLMAFTGFKVFDNPVLFDTAMTHKRMVVLAHDKNFFTVEFAALDFANPAKNMYRYKLEGLDEQWRTTDGNKPSASYTGVPPGEYTLHVQGSNSDDAWNTKGIRLTVVITPAWWQTWWFKFAVLALLAVLVVLGLQWRYRSLKRRNEVEKKLVESQLQALRSQMNPHFIFNSLNSILHFITSNEQETAHVYLSKFSKLIRAILEQSRNEFIPLSEELYVLGLYLELEALRFDNRFSYSITVSEGIDVQEQQIPPMLLQPHVENAIKHGLIHTVSDGRLEVVIRREGEHVICSVIDNGIGRQRSQLLRGQSVVDHISRGTSLAEDRLSILNNLHSAQYGVEIHDLTGADGLARGTRVDVKIASAAEEQEG